MAAAVACAKRCTIVKLQQRAMSQSETSVQPLGKDGKWLPMRPVGT